MNKKISVEFFPPKTQEGAEQILNTAEKIKSCHLDFVSITYGAGGSSRERTLEYGKILKKKFGFNVVPHLTCVGHSKDELKEILTNFSDSGFKRIMALRGDTPSDTTNYHPNKDSFKYANELISFIKKEFPQFKISCAGYPEKHPEAKDSQSDILNLKKKIDAGADSIITQLFFDNNVFFNFKNKCKDNGINAKIIAGILPPLSLKQAENFCSMCGATLPEKLREDLCLAKNESESIAVGIQWAKNQIEELVKLEIPIHLYILNRSKSVLEILKDI